MKHHFSAMDEAGARDIVQWRYQAPYQMYNMQDSSSVKEVVEYLIDPKNQIYRIDNDQQAMLAFCSFGNDAQVGGGDYAEEALDVGLGMRPSLTGQGLGPELIAEVLSYAAAHFEFTKFRATIAAFNQRAQKAWLKNGFEYQQEFIRSFDGFPFVILIRDVLYPDQD
ncbi:MAG: GNAT family N-acetyltransferase [Anaerolineaceae bacterium]|nr:GNAT family N-acetyltransferase [Anaerolineaceae bacterium]